MKTYRVFIVFIHVRCWTAAERFIFKDDQITDDRTSLSLETNTQLVQFNSCRDQKSWFFSRFLYSSFSSIEEKRKFIQLCNIINDCRVTFDDNQYLSRHSFFFHFYSTLNIIKDYYSRKMSARQLITSLYKRVHPKFETKYHIGSKQKNSLYI